MASRRDHLRPTSTFGSRTDVGTVREQNEDSLAVEPPLYVVCDGMGGHAAGEVASEIAVRTISERAPKTPDASALGQAVEEANLAIIQAAKLGEGRQGMGTTCTAAILENERLVIAQVGDSRAYVLHQGQLQQITRDHSLVADLVEAGEITEEEAREHPQRSMITRALGSDPHMVPDLFEINVETGDRLLLCSDGLTSMLTDAEIETVMCRNRDPQRCAAVLVNEAIAAGGFDNVTVIVVDVTGFAEARTTRLARRTKISAAIIVALLAVIVGGAIGLYSLFTSNAAYLAEDSGKVAIYQGVQGNLFGLSSSRLVRVTDIAVDDLQPGLANRLRGDGIKVASLEEAEQLVEEYEDELAQNQSDKTAGQSEAASDDAMQNPADRGADGQAENGQTGQSGQTTLTGQSGQTARAAGADGARPS